MVFVLFPRESIMTGDTNNLNIFRRVGLHISLRSEVYKGDDVMGVQLSTGFLCPTNLTGIIRLFLIFFRKFPPTRAMVGSAASFPVRGLIGFGVRMVRFTSEAKRCKEFSFATMVTEMPFGALHIVWSFPKHLTAVGTHGLNFVFSCGVSAFSAAIFTMARRIALSGILYRALKGGTAMSAN